MSGRAVLVGIAAPLIVACSDDSPGGPQLPECVGKVAVAVSDGATPEFSWVPECRLLFLVVESDTGGADLWSVITPGGNRIGPPVRYGVVPPGAEQFTAPSDLAVGTQYRVMVARWTGPGPDDHLITGGATFTP